MREKNREQIPCHAKTGDHAVQQENRTAGDRIVHLPGFHESKSHRPQQRLERWLHGLRHGQRGGLLLRRLQLRPCVRLNHVRLIRSGAGDLPRKLRLIHALSTAQAAKHHKHMQQRHDDGGGIKHQSKQSAGAGGVRGHEPYMPQPDPACQERSRASLVRLEIHRRALLPPVRAHTAPVPAHRRLHERT